MIKAANARMNDKLYRWRSLVETVISVITRTYGDAVSSWEWSERFGATLFSLSGRTETFRWMQFRELVAMCLVYNVEQAVKPG